MCPRGRPQFTRSLLSQHKLVSNHGPQWEKEKLPGSFLFRAFRRHTQAGFFRAILGACLVIGLLQILPWNNQIEVAWVRTPLLSNWLLRGRPPSLESHPPPQNSLTEISLSLTSLSETAAPQEGSLKEPYWPCTKQCAA